MANLWWLKHTISSLHNKLWPALVNEADPAFVTVDHLELDPVEVNVVLDRTFIENPDVRRNEAAAKATRNQVAVEHAFDTPLMPVLLVRVVHDERCL